MQVLLRSRGQTQMARFDVPAFLAALKAMGLRSYDIAPHGLTPSRLTICQSALKFDPGSVYSKIDLIILP
jgi:hypothetical protein